MGRTIDLVPEEAFAASGIIKYVKWDYGKFPHIAISGHTGSGKTYLLKIILGRIGLHIPQSELIICDFKGDDDFSFADGCANFYRFDRCMDGLQRAMKLLQDRQNRVVSDRHFFCLVFDEWASFLNSLDKKSADSAKQTLSMILMLGRSYDIHVILSQQRMDATHFNSSRDNFSVVFGMGTLSKEAVDMMFSEYKDVIVRSKPQGHGSLVIGSQFKEIVVPTVHDSGRLQAAILLAVNRPQDESH